MIEKMFLASQRVSEENARYMRARVFIGMLQKHIDVVTMQEYRTLKGQALAGDIDGAYRGLDTLIERRRQL